MIYRTVYTSKKERGRNYDISYSVIEDEKSFYLESLIKGGRICEKISIGNCGFKKADSLARCFAKRAVHPMHIENIISDMRL